jgi:hypothetical protein
MTLRDSKGKLGEWVLGLTFVILLYFQGFCFLRVFVAERLVTAHKFAWAREERPPESLDAAEKSWLEGVSAHRDMIRPWMQRSLIVTPFLLFSAFALGRRMAKRQL